MGTRYNQKTLTATQRKAFVNAVIGVKKQKSVLHPDDHAYSRYDDFVEVHLNAMTVMMNNEQSWGHQAAAFGPWHRVLLHEFEGELQQIDPSVTIPYWDWTDADAGSCGIQTFWAATATRRPGKSPRGGSPARAASGPSS